MKAQRQPMQVLERRQRNRPDGVLPDLGKDRVAQFAEDLRGNARDAVGDDQRNRQAGRRQGRVIG